MSVFNQKDHAQLLRRARAICDKYRKRCSMRADQRGEVDDVIRLLDIFVGPQKMPSMVKKKED